MKLKDYLNTYSCIDFCNLYITIHTESYGNQIYISKNGEIAIVGSNEIPNIDDSSWDDYVFLQKCVGDWSSDEWNMIEVFDVNGETKGYIDGSFSNNDKQTTLFRDKEDLFCWLVREYGVPVEWIDMIYDTEIDVL